MSSREKQQLADEMNRKPSKNDENKETLRAVICVCRHGDRLARRHALRNRTPKQKMKFKVTSESLLNKLQPWGSRRKIRRSVITDPRKEVKIKEASQMNQIVSIVTEQIHEMQTVPQAKDPELEGSDKENANSVLKTRLLQLVAVMQQGGQFKGFNRKFQLRALQWHEEKEEVPEEKTETPVVTPTAEEPFELRHGVEKVGLRGANEGQTIEKQDKKDTSLPRVPGAARTGEESAETHYSERERVV